MKTTYKLNKNGNELILEKTTEAGKLNCVCPFSQPLLIPDKFGIQIAPRYCGSSCPFFEIVGDETILHCRSITFELEPEKSNLLL